MISILVTAPYPQPIRHQHQTNSDNWHDRSLMHSTQVDATHCIIRDKSLQQPSTRIVETRGVDVIYYYFQRLQVVIATTRSNREIFFSLLVRQVVGTPLSIDASVLLITRSFRSRCSHLKLLSLTQACKREKI
jgi:hypothetical protein